MEIGTLTAWRTERFGPENTRTVAIGEPRHHRRLDRTAAGDYANEPAPPFLGLSTLERSTLIQIVIFA
jgi:hypothetical protein